MTRKKVLFLMVCGLFLCGTNQADVTVVNSSFEDPAMEPGAIVFGVTDWFDAVSYSWTCDDASGGIPATPYGDNWAYFGSGRWMYQQIGTYSENTTYNITFLVGQDSTRDFDGVYVELFAGGNPLLAADVDVKRDGSIGAFPLDSVVGAVQIATTEKLNPFPDPGLATEEMSVYLSTGTAGIGYAVGEPLWLLFSRDSITSRSLIDNVAVTPVVNNPVVVNPSFEDPELVAGTNVLSVTDWFDSVSYTWTCDDASDSIPATPYGDNWTNLGNGRWVYQQIGTYYENMTYNVIFLAGQSTSSEFDGVRVELFAGGDPNLAADVDAKRDGDTGVAFPLDSVVGAVQIATTEKLNPFPDPGLATEEMSVYLSTGTAGIGYAVGEPLWLLFSRDSITSRSLIDNVAVTPVVNNPVVVNPSFEDPELVAGTNVLSVTDWFDSVSYTWTCDDASDSIPATPYGDNWTNLGNGRWVYQQIGTYYENTTYNVIFLAGQSTSSEFDGVRVELFAGGDPNLAADVDAKRDGGTGVAFPLDSVVGAVQIATTEKLNPFPALGLATQEMSVDVSTGTAGTGYAVGEPLWLLFSTDSVTARALIDNVTITLATTDPTVVNPTPNIGARYIDPTAAMSWDVQNIATPTFDINIGTDSACNDVLSFHSTASEQSYTPSAGLLNYITEYFWRVDVTDDSIEYTGTIWSFTTGGNATRPVPASGTTADRSVGIFSWSGDASISSYDIWFGYPGNLQFVDNSTATSVSFEDLAAALGQSLLAADDYQWRVDTRDGSNSLMVTGDVWDVTIPNVDHIVLEDLGSYNDTSEMLANWTAGEGAQLTLHDFYGSMQFDYDTQALPYRSEATLAFATAQDWNATNMDTFAVTFSGLESNDPESMYFNVNDGTVTATVVYPQADATTDRWWGTWHIRLSDFSEQGLDLGHVTSLTIGLGDGSGPGGAGTIYIDDFLLDLVGCISAFHPLGDLNKDCRSTIEDVVILAGDWLMKDFAVTPVSPDSGQLLGHYLFNEAAGSATAADSSGSGNNATVDANDLDIIWSVSGYNDGCIEFDSSVAVTIPIAVFNGVTDEVTISMWVNGDSTDYPDRVNQAFFAAGLTSGDENIWDSATWDIDTADAYGGQWNHYAAIKNTITGVMNVYHNGVLVGQTTSAADSMEGALAGDSILSLAGFDSETTPKVKVDDLRIYGYALSQVEIAGLAGGSVVQPIEPIYTEYDLDDDGSIDLSDFAIVARDWLEEK